MDENDLQSNRRPRSSSWSSMSSSTSSSSSCASSVICATESRRSRVGSWRGSESDITELKSVQLLWNNKIPKHIWDVTFMRDGRILVIAGKDAKADAKVVTIYSKELHCFSLSGQKLALPIDDNFMDPGGVAICRSTGSVAVTDKPGKDSQGGVTVYSKVGDNWGQRVHTTGNTAFRLGLTPTDIAVCAVRWEKIVKYQAGEAVWNKSISSSNDLVPYVALDNEGNIIVSTPANDRVSVFRQNGQLLTVFPTWFVKRPAGVCADSRGRVYIADKANHTVSQFTINGRFLQRVTQTQVEPRCISILNDKYLAVGTNYNGLFLYKLEWD